MKSQIKFFFLIFIFSGISLNVFSQIRISYNSGENTACDKKLEEAQILYNSGLFFESEKLLKEILKDCDINKARKQDVYELLIKNQLETDEVNAADSAVYKMLKKNPNYELKERNNSEDFNRLIKKFDVYPRFTIGARNSALHPTFKIKKTYSVLDGVDYNAAYQTSSKYYFITEYYGWLEYGINKKISINVECIFNGFTYSRDFTKGNNWQMQYTETMNFFEMPVYVKAYLPLSKNVISYAGVGGAWMRMLKAKATAGLSVIKEDIYTSEKTQYIYNDGDIDVLSMRTKNSFEAIAEIGLGYKFRNLKIFLFTRYFKGLNSLSNPAHRFDSSLLINGYSYIDNSFLINKYELGATVSFVLKNTVKKMK